MKEKELIKKFKLDERLSPYGNPIRDKLYLVKPFGVPWQEHNNDFRLGKLYNVVFSCSKQGPYNKEYTFYTMELFKEGKDLVHNGFGYCKIENSYIRLSIGFLDKFEYKLTKKQKLEFSKYNKKRDKLELELKKLINT